MKAQQEAPISQEEYPHVRVTPMWRAAVHVWLIVHLTALIAAPLAFATREAPESIARHMYRLTRPYIDLCFLDHGYAFFAPEVGASHLVEYRVWQEGESQPEVDRFPNLQRQRPRLLYHRHFMLSEYLHSRHAPADLPRDYFVDTTAYQRWQADRAVFEKLRDSFSGHLQHVHGAQRVELVRIEHRQPFPTEFESGIRLDDDSLYRALPDTLPPAPASPPTVLEAPRPMFPLPYTPGPVNP